MDLLFRQGTGAGGPGDSMHIGACRGDPPGRVIRGHTCQSDRILDSAGQNRAPFDRESLLEYDRPRIGRGQDASGIFHARCWTPPLSFAAALLNFERPAFRLSNRRLYDAQPAGQVRGKTYRSRFSWDNSMVKVL